MTFIEKVKSSIVYGAGVPQFYYHAAGELNAILADHEIGDEVVAFCYLLAGGDVEVGRQCKESVQLAVFFCKKTEFDFNSFENEQLIDDCKKVAFGWLSHLTKSPYLTIDGDVSTQRVYDTTTDILTGIGINIALREQEGYGWCDIPEKVFYIKNNGVYYVLGYDRVCVSVDTIAPYFDDTHYPDEAGAFYFPDGKNDTCRKISNREVEQVVIVDIHEKDTEPDQGGNLPGIIW